MRRMKLLSFFNLNAVRDFKHDIEPCERIAAKAGRQRRTLQIMRSRKLRHQID